MARRPNRESEAPEKGERRKILQYIGAVSALGILALALLLVPKGNATAGSCSPILIAQDRYPCIMNLALSTENASVCSQLPPPYSAGCYVLIAENESNPSLCRAAAEANTTSGSECYGYFVNSTLNYTLCNYVGAQNINACFAGVAAKTGNPGICGYVNKESAAAACATEVKIISYAGSGNFAGCESLRGYVNQSVFDYVAGYSDAGQGYANNLYVALSYLFMNSSARFYGNDTCMAISAAYSSNSGYCGHIANPELGSICNAYIQPSAQQNQTAIRPANYSSQNATSLLRSYLSSCENLTSPNKTACMSIILATVAVDTRNASICSGLSMNLSSECYSAIASTYNNATYCGYISNKSVQYSCVLGAYSNSSA